jgi:hypothetical protein
MQRYSEIIRLSLRTRIAYVAIMTSHHTTLILGGAPPFDFTSYARDAAVAGAWQP